MTRTRWILATLGAVAVLAFVGGHSMLPYQRARLHAAVPGPVSILLSPLIPRTSAS